jgi:hypothetical protein
MLHRLHALVLGCGLGKNDQVLQAALDICQAAAGQGAYGIPWDPIGSGENGPQTISMVNSQ